MTEILSAVFIFLFVYAAVSKLIDYEKFTVQIGQSPMLTSHAGIISWFIPVVELIIALLLLFEKTRQIGLYSFFALMVLFSGYIVLASHFSDYLPCSCGGVIANLNWSQHLVFNGVFVFGSLVAILFYPIVSSTTSKEMPVRK